MTSAISKKATATVGRVVQVGNSGTETEGVKVVEGVGVGFGVEVDGFVIVKLIVSDLAKSPHPSQA